MARNRTRRLPPEWWERLNDWHENRTVVEIYISGHPDDLRSPTVDYGDFQIPVHVAWDAPIGATRQARLFQTAGKQFYWVPAGERQPDGSIKFLDADKMRSNEFDPARQRVFRARLQRNKDGRLSFVLPSGLRLVLMALDQWIEAGVEKLVGQVLEVVGWPRATSWVVIPHFGFENLVMTSQLSTETEDKTKMGLLRARQRAMGFVFVHIEGVGDLPAAATSLLGLSADATLSLDVVKRAAKLSKARVQAGTAYQESLVGIAAKGELMRACDDAREVLTAMVRRGVTSFVGKAEEENGAGQDSESESARTAEVVCPACGRKNRVDLSRKDRGENVVCGTCGADLFPGEPKPQTAALPVEAESPAPSPEPAVAAEPIKRGVPVKGTSKRRRKGEGDEEEQSRAGKGHKSKPKKPRRGGAKDKF